VCRLRGSETGYVERRNLGIEWRRTEGQYDRLPALAADLVAQQVAVIVASGGSGAASSFALLVLEAVLRAMPVASTPPVESPTAENPIQRCAPSSPGHSAGISMSSTMDDRTRKGSWPITITMPRPQHWSLPWLETVTLKVYECRSRRRLTDGYKPRWEAVVAPMLSLNPDRP
jgi:hypothetical protein